jgi:hypothetical protein
MIGVLLEFNIFFSLFVNTILLSYCRSGAGIAQWRSVGLRAG